MNDMFAQQVVAEMRGVREQLAALNQNFSAALALATGSRGEDLDRPTDLHAVEPGAGLASQPAAPSAGNQQDGADSQSQGIADSAALNSPATNAADSKPAKSDGKGKNKSEPAAA